MVDLVDWLMARQGKMSNAAFARLLGISESYWSLVHRRKLGRRGPSLMLLRKATEAFPEDRQALCDAAVGEPDAAA